MSDMVIDLWARKEEGIFLTVTRQARALGKYTGMMVISCGIIPTLRHLLYFNIISQIIHRSIRQNVQVRFHVKRQREGLITHQCAGL